MWIRFASVYVSLVFSITFALIANTFSIKFYDLVNIMISSSCTVPDKRCPFGLHLIPYIRVCCFCASAAPFSFQLLYRYVIYNKYKSTPPGLSLDRRSKFELSWRSTEVTIYILRLISTAARSSSISQRRDHLSMCIYKVFKVNSVAP